MDDELGSFRTLVDIVERLRSPDGCPWDREQTHASLKRNLLEECYEVLEAIDTNDPVKLSEELGDILVQVVFHAQMAGESRQFGIQDVVSKVGQKLTRRHPHVFGDADVSDSHEVERNWDALKRQEQPGKSPVEGIPQEMPALAHAQLLQDRVSRVGFEWEEVAGVLDKIEEEINELRTAPSIEEKSDELGDLLFSVVNLARWMGIHAEDALRQTNIRFRRRYQTMENLAAERSLDFTRLPLEEKEKLWQEAKRHTG